MTGADILQLALSAGVATIIVGIINAVMNRKKLSAEATQIITQAAAGTVETVMKDNAQLREKQAILEAQVARLTTAVALAEQSQRTAQAMDERWHWHVDRWHRYAGRLCDELRAMGGQIEDPPPRWPEPITASELRE